MRLNRSRLLLALLILGTVAWAWTTPVFNRVSTLAVVNAEIIRLTAPFQGLVAADLPRPGTRLPAGTEFGIVERAVPEERERDRLRLELATSRSRLSRLEQSLSILDLHRHEVESRWQALVEAASEVLARSREEAEALRAAALARAEQATTELTLAEEMRRRGIYAETRVAAARSALIAAEAEAAAATARIETIAARLRALRRGVHLSDGYNDVPYSVQQLDRLLLLREQLLDRLAEERARERAIAQALANEEEASQLRSRFIHRTDRHLVVWARHATPGAPVPNGAPLLDLIDCNRLFVDALLPDRAFPRLAGESPQLHFSGGLTARGRLSELRGAGARDTPGLLTAARPPADAKDRLTARIELPAGLAAELEGDDNGLCGIGRQAEVVFPGELPHFLSGIAERAQRLFGRATTAEAHRLRRE